MDFLQVLILSVVQGITEFLPVSSSAHLIAVPHVFGWADQGVIFDIAVHVGTLGAVMVYFKKETKAIFVGLFDCTLGRTDSAGARMIFQLAIATMPLVIAALLFSKWQAEAARSIEILAIASIGFGILLYMTDIRPHYYPKTQGVSMHHAFIFGLFQALAIIPGTSRSGICITAGRLLGYDRHTAGRFATLMAIPAIGLAGGYSLMKTDVAGVDWATNWDVLALGVFFSFLCGLAGIHVLMKLLTKTGYWPFVLYRVVLGIALLVWLR